jgi:hypothetical protein
MLPRPHLLRKWRSWKTAVVEKKVSGKSHGEYPSGDETTIVDSRNESDDGDRCIEEDTVIKNAAILDKLRVLIEEAKAAIQTIEAKTKPAVDNDHVEKDNEDIQNLNTMIDEAKTVIENLDSKVMNASMEKKLRLLFDDSHYVISQVMSTPITCIVEDGSLAIKKTVSCADEGGVKHTAPDTANKDTNLENNEVVVVDESRGDITRESALEGLLEEVRLLTGVDDTSKRSAAEESTVEESNDRVDESNEDVTVTNTSKTNEVDDRNFLVLIADIVGEIGGMLAEDSAKLAEKAPWSQCWY